MTGAGHMRGGGVIFGDMEDAVDGMRHGGGGEQQPPQLVQDRGAAVLLTLPYGFMEAGLVLDTASLPSVNSGTIHTAGPSTDARCPRPPVEG